MSKSALWILLLANFSALSVFGDTMPDRLPVGDSKVSTTPEVGYMIACNQNFRVGGARHVGDWFDGESRSPAEKPHVQGRVTWPNAQFAIAVAPDTLEITGNGLPVGQPTGGFSIKRSDPAHEYGTNPNPIQPIELDFVIPREPQKTAAPGCLSMGMIGFTTTGVAIYDALDDTGHDAAAHEMQDPCNGHPRGKGQYHYHNASACLPGWTATILSVGRWTAIRFWGSGTQAASCWTVPNSTPATAGQRRSRSRG